MTDSRKTTTDNAKTKDYRDETSHGGRVQESRQTATRGVDVMPHIYTASIRNASAVRSTLPTLCNEIHKTALGAEDSVDWQYFPTALEAVTTLQARGYEVLAVEQAEGSTKLPDFTPNTDKRYAVVMGNEVKGVHQEVIDATDGCIEIPQIGTKHSMNVSVTAGIIMYKFAEPAL